MPQHKLPLQHGPQDALLLDCSRSYFNNVGYVRTCDFQQEIKDITSTNTPAFGTTIHFTIDRAADLLGQLDQATSSIHRHVVGWSSVRFSITLLRGKEELPIKK